MVSCVEGWAETSGQEPGPSQEFSDQCRILSGDPTNPKPKDWPRASQEPIVMGDSGDNIEFQELLGGRCLLSTSSTLACSQELCLVSLGAQKVPVQTYLLPGPSGSTLAP